MTANAARKPRLAIVAPDLSSLLARGIAAQQLFDVALVHARHPIKQAARVMRLEYDCLITCLRDDDSVVDLRELFAVAADATIVFLVDHLPVASPMEHLIALHGHIAVPRSEPDIVLEATVIARMAQSNRYASTSRF
jgi:hypothetical protein